jgi:hypothetical protein
MQYNKKYLLGSLALICGLMSMGNPVFAETNQFICAAAEAVACAQDEPCVRGSANSVNLPLLWKVNLKDKHIKSLRESGEQRTSEIINLIEGESTITLFGIDPGSAWSVIIDKNDGKMTMTSSTYDAGYIVHGACNNEILK